MAIYPLNKVTFIQERGHAPAAALEANEHATPEQLASICDNLEKAGWQQIPLYEDSRNVLQVSGFKDAVELRQWLHDKNFINDKTTISHQEALDPSSAIGKIERSSLKLTGFLNILGDAILAVSGHHKKDPYRMAGGTLLSLGSLNLMRYGNVAQSHYVREVSDDLQTFISKQDGTPPPKVDALTKIEDRLYRNPVQTTLGISTLGAASNLISGIRTSRAGGGWGALGFGIGSVGLKIVSLLVPEKAKDKDASQSGGVVGWIQEKPMRFYGYGSLASDIFLGVDAFQEYKQNPKNWALYTSTALAGACYSLGDLTVAMSHKDHTNQEGGKFTAYEQKEIEAMAAASLLHQPLIEQQHKADSLGEFLAKRKEMQGSAKSISEAIIEQANQLRSNSWVERSSKTSTSPAI